MYIDKFYKNYRYYDKDNIEYDNAEEFIQSGILKFCGCGMPDESIKYVGGALNLLDRQKKLLWEKKISFEDWNKEVKKYFNNSLGCEYFMWYYLDEIELTEHGSSVPGWLTEKGEGLLKDIKELYKLK